LADYNVDEDSSKAIDLPVRPNPSPKM